MLIKSRGKLVVLQIDNVCMLKPWLQEQEDLTTFRELLASHTNIIFDSGYRRPTTTATLLDKQETINTIFIHQTIYSCLAKLDQLNAGLNVLGVVDELSKSPNLLIDFFMSVNTIKLTAS